MFFLNAGYQGFVELFGKFALSTSINRNFVVILPISVIFYVLESSGFVFSEFSTFLCDNAITTDG